MAERYYSQCRNYLKGSDVDLVHVITPDPSAMVIIRAAHAEGVPVIYQELGTPYHPPDYESYYKEFTSVLPLCAEVAALSPYLAKQCLEQLPHSNPPSVLPIMVDGPRQRNTPHSRSSSNVTFGFAARIEYLKGPLLLIDAFAAVCGEDGAMRLKIAGAGSQGQTVLSRAEELGITHRCLLSGVYTKPEQKSSFMRSLDVFVLPSHTEGTPNSIVEAMAHGLPVIASAVGGIPDVVTPETGILTPPGDVRALADAMKRLASDPELRARMSVAAKERYEKLFSPKAVLPVMLETYKRVAVKNGALSVSAKRNGHAHPWGL
jgi:glycosyltransferase involved in cell wall biosynthesis